MRTHVFVVSVYNNGSTAGRGAEASYGQLERQRVNELRKISWNHLLVKTCCQ